MAQDVGVQRQSLKDQVRQSVEEARMVLPGVQALFGFQMIAVFNQRFAEALSGFLQGLHLIAIVCVVLSIALLMAPAAWHRQVQRGAVSPELICYASRCITLSLLPLIAAIGIDVGIVAALTLRRGPLALAVGVAGALIPIGLWFVGPQLRRRRGP